MSYSSEILTDTPAAYWRMGEASGNMLDSSGNNVTLDAGGTLTRNTTSLIGSDTSNGSCTYVAGSNSTGTDFIDPRTNDTTIEFWITTPGSVTGTQWICVGSYMIYLQSDTSTIKLGKQYGDAIWNNVLDYSTTYHVAIVTKATTCDLYRDGAFVSAKSSTIDRQAAGIRIGAANGAHSNPLTAVLDEFAIYDADISGRLDEHYVAAQPPASQLAAPTADSVDGAWTDQAGGTSLFAAIDETSFSDTDYIRSELAPSSSGCRVKLDGSLVDPLSSTGHIVRWRPGKDTTAGDTINMTVKLYQGGGNSLGGGTLIADFVRSNVDSFTTYAEELSGGEADSITDYTDLYLEFHADTA